VQDITAIYSKIFINVQTEAVCQNW